VQSAETHPTDADPGRVSGRYLAEFRRPLLIVGIATVGLTATYVVAVQRPVPGWELRLTEAINGVPDFVASTLYPVMQMGTFAGPIIVAVVIAVFRRDLVLSAAVVLAGVTTWFAAKWIKKIVERDRPLAYLPDIVVREGDGTGFGYVSGHSAVAASAAIMAMVAIPRRWRPLAALVAALVGVARIVHGVHLPADVVGGWSFGVLMGLAGLWLAGSVADRRIAAA
jgi:membrane-associated phospholipid phosphatase